ncbi:MAG: class II aldolase/adducin family protein [Candidatus Aenigmarchaeota archaeon]|nr:class II aldolase/adducin family protein [Candidatus Aenigmarchaeota archaeon]
MGDEYVGRKFRTEFKSNDIPQDTRIYEIIRLGEKFKKMGLLPDEDGGHAGNFSFRNSKGFVITSGGRDKGNLSQKNFVQVLNVNVDSGRVIVKGEEQPSSETLTHHLLYSGRKSVNAVIHVHDDIVLKNAHKLNIKSTERKHPYGTAELAKDIYKSIGRENFLAVRGHGVIATGKSLWEAGKIIETMHHAAENI